MPAYTRPPPFAWISAISWSTSAPWVASARRWAAICAALRRSNDRSCSHAGASTRTIAPAATAALTRPCAGSPIARRAGGGAPRAAEGAGGARALELVPDPAGAPRRAAAGEQQRGELDAHHEPAEEDVAAAGDHGDERSERGPSERQQQARRERDHERARAVRAPCPPPRAGERRARSPRTPSRPGSGRDRAAGPSRASRAPARRRSRSTSAVPRSASLVAAHGRWSISGTITHAAASSDRRRRRSRPGARSPRSAGPTTSGQSSSGSERQIAGLEVQRDRQRDERDRREASRGRRGSPAS